MEQNAQELQETSPADVPRAGFVQAAALPARAADLISAQSALQNDFRRMADANDIAAIRETRASLLLLEKDLLRLVVDVNAALLDNDLKVIRCMIDAIEEDNIGADFLQRESEGRCTVTIDRSLGKDDGAPLATYQSYSYDKGLINEILINEFKLGNIFSLANGVTHELFHRFQAMSAPALAHNHSNADTRILIHPEDWIHLENICERDAYAKQTMINYLLSKMHDEAKIRSGFDIVSVHEFEDYRNLFQTLRETVIHASLNALYKPTRENDYSRFFYQHYQESALDRYITSMGRRRNDGQTGLVFARLEPADFWAVGAYGVGPNSLGEHHLDPGFLKRMEMGEEVRRKLKLLCEQHNIPTLGDCPTLCECTAPRPHAEPQSGRNGQDNQGDCTTNNHNGLRGGYASSRAIHAPSFT